MPHFTGKLGSQPISQRSQTGRQHLGDVLVGQHLRAFSALMTVDAAAQALFRDAFVHALIGRDRRRDD